MIQNPFQRKRDPLSQALDTLDSLRSDAAGFAADVRDAASKAADALGEAAPEGTSKRLPLIGVAAAGVAAIVVVAKVRRRSSAASAPQPVAPPAASASPSAVATAAKTTTAPPPAPSNSGPGEVKEEPAEAADPVAEPLTDPKAETEESRAAGEEANGSS